MRRGGPKPGGCEDLETRWLSPCCPSNARSDNIAFQRYRMLKFMAAERLCPPMSESDCYRDTALSLLVDEPMARNCMT